MRARLWRDTTVGGSREQTSPCEVREWSVDAGGDAIRRGNARVQGIDAGTQEIPILPVRDLLSDRDRRAPASPLT